MRAHKFFDLRQNSVSGFTLIEMMIVTAIIAVLAGISIPFYLKFEFDAKEAEATQMLMAAWKDQQRVAAECAAGVYAACDSQNKYTDALDSVVSGTPTLFYRPATQNPRFNLLTGSTIPDNNKKYSLQELGYQIQGYPAASHNKAVFGMKKISVFDPNTGMNVDQLVGNNFVLGAEGVINGRTHLLAVTADGNLLKVCDAWTGQANAAAQAAIFTITDNTPDCSSY